MAGEQPGATYMLIRSTAALLPPSHVAHLCTTREAEALLSAAVTLILLKLKQPSVKHPLPPAEPQPAAVSDHGDLGFWVLHEVPRLWAGS